MNELSGTVKRIRLVEAVTVLRQRVYRTKSHGRAMVGQKQNRLLPAHSHLWKWQRIHVPHKAGHLQPVPCLRVGIWLWHCWGERQNNNESRLLPRRSQSGPTNGVDNQLSPTAKLGDGATDRDQLAQRNRQVGRRSLATVRLFPHRAGHHAGAIID